MDKCPIAASEQFLTNDILFLGLLILLTGFSLIELPFYVIRHFSIYK